MKNYDETTQIPPKSSQNQAEIKPNPTEIKPDRIKIKPNPTKIESKSRQIKSKSKSNPKSNRIKIKPKSSQKSSRNPSRNHYKQSVKGTLTRTRGAELACREGAERERRTSATHRAGSRLPWDASRDPRQKCARRSDRPDASKGPSGRVARPRRGAERLNGFLGNHCEIVASL